MKILLTGATGYLGSHLARHMLKNKYKVVVLKRSFSLMQRLKGIENDLVYYDLDKTDLITIFKKEGVFDIIIHASTCYGKKGEDKNKIFESNTVFPLKLLEIAERFKTKIFINTDTYYNKAKHTPVNLNNYILSKKNFIENAKSYSKNKKIKLINLILEHVYGPNDSQHKFVNWLVRSLYEKKKTIELTKGEQIRDMIFIDDVVSAYDTILNNISKINQDYLSVEVGTGTTITLREFTELASKLSKSNSKLVFGGIPYQENEIMFSKADNKILRNFNWNYSVNINEGLTKVINSNYL